MTKASPTFEEQMERLQAIVAELEGSDLALERSVSLYQEGQNLVRACREQLETARLTVTVHGEDGPRPFDGEVLETPEDESLC